MRKSQPLYYSIESLFETIIKHVAKLHSTEVINAKYSGGSLWIILKNILKFKKIKNSVCHITGDIHYMALATGRNTVLTIHDIGSALKGSVLKKLYIKTLWFWLPALFVKRITVISEFTKRELELIIPFAKNKIKVVYNPISHLFKQKDYTFNQQCPTILCIGSKSNKNLERLFESLRGITCKLHLIGHLSDKQLRLLQEYHINYINSVNLTQKEIVESYENCDLLCFPSTYEGFGMPIIEAQAVGRPVITSNVGAMLEVANNSACLVDPFDYKSIKKGIVTVIANEDYRNQLIKKGLNNTKRFKAEVIAKEYVKVYEEVLNS